MGGVNPGSISNQMPPQDDDFGRTVRDLLRSTRENASAKTGQAMQIGSGGITITDGGSLTISGTGALNVGSGALNSGGSISAGTTITAGGNIISTGGGLTVAGAVTGGSANFGSGSVAAGTITAAALGTSGDVNASGRVISAGIIHSPGTKSNTVTVGYSAVYIDVNGDMGGNTSSLRYKQDIEPVDAAGGFLGLTVYRFRYISAVEAHGDAAPFEYGLIAEEVVKVAPWACFYEDDGVTVRGINYDRLIVAALSVLQDHEERLNTLERGTH